MCKRPLSGDFGRDHIDKAPGHLEPSKNTITKWREIIGARVRVNWMGLLKFLPEAPQTQNKSRTARFSSIREATGESGGQTH